MADKQEEIAKSIEALPKSQASVAVAPEPKSSQISPSSQKEPEKDKDAVAASRVEPVMSEGEEKFNSITYKGLGFWTNLGLSVVLAEIAIYGKGMWSKGLKYSINRTTYHISNVLKSLSKNPNQEAIERMVHNNTRVGYESLSLLTGGSILLFPLKFLEDNKRKIVHWLNNKMGVDQTAPDGHEKTPEEIYIEKEQPKQSAGNLIKRRLIGTVSVVGAGFV